MKTKTYQMMVQGTADVVRKYVAEQVAPLKARIAKLEARGSGGVKWCGVYAGDKRYLEGSLVTKNGLWLATCDTSDRPGSSPDWRLVVKGNMKGDSQ
jgi:hypothetical protein